MRQLSVRPVEWSVIIASCVRYFRRAFVLPCVRQNLSDRIQHENCLPSTTTCSATRLYVVKL